MPRDKSVVFHFAVGKKIGMGHLRRSEALAVELARRGWKIRGQAHGAEPDEKPLDDLALSPEFPISAPPSKETPGLCVIDSYLVPPAEREALGRGGALLMSFLDAPIADPSDLIVDVNAGADAEAYAAAGCRGRVLAGPDYFTVRPALLKAANRSHGRSRVLAARRLLLTFGGSDWHHLAARTLHELAEVGAKLEIRVAGGDLGGRSPELLDAVKTLPGAELVPPGTELGAEFARTDLAVSAAGLTKYELALFGVPAIIVAIAANQEVGARDFAARGSAFYLGRAADLAPGTLGRAVAELSVDSVARAEMSEAGRRMVDGRGAERIAAEIEKLWEESP